MGINNPVALELENLEVLQKLGENNGRLTFNGAIVSGSGGSNQGNTNLSINTLNYTWEAEFGYNYKLDAIALPMLAILTQISSNIPARVRLYRSNQDRQQDLYRPPYVNPESLMQRRIFLDAVLSGNGEELTLELSPVVVIGNLQQCPIIIEKMLPDAGTINLRFDYIG